MPWPAIPYMGVGRNLSYKKDLFFRNKGFSAINHVPGGDDDLFINKVATKDNTAIVVDPDTFTLSEPKKTFGEWFRQKTRHYSTAKYYRPRHKFLLGLYSASLPALLSPADRQPLLRLAYDTHHLWHPPPPPGLSSSTRPCAASEKKISSPGGGSLDIWMFVYYLIFASTLWKKPRPGLEIVLQYFADFSPAQLQQLAALGDLYREWNAKINVISRKDIDSLYEKHVLHSLAIAAAFTFTPGMQVLDIGTGGGFPGIPLAIFFPATRFHLVDSIGKKIKVVEAVSDAIGLTNVTTQHAAPKK